MKSPILFSLLLPSLLNLLSLKKNLFVCVFAKVFLAALPIQMCFCDSMAEVTSGFVLQRSHGRYFLVEKSTWTCSPRSTRSGEWWGGCAARTSRPSARSPRAQNRFFSLAAAARFARDRTTVSTLCLIPKHISDPMVQGLHYLC